MLAGALHLSLPGAMLLWAGAWIAGTLTSVTSARKLSVLPAILALGLPWLIEGPQWMRTVQSFASALLFCASLDLALGHGPASWGRRWLYTPATFLLIDTSSAVRRQGGIPRHEFVRGLSAITVMAGCIYAWSVTEPAPTIPKLIIRVIAAGFAAFAAAELNTAVAVVIAAALGYDVRPPHLEPFRSRTILDFWSRRWDLLGARWLRQYLFLKARRLGVTGAMFVMYGVSGLLHAYLVAASVSASMSLLVACEPSPLFLLRGDKLAAQLVTNHAGALSLGRLLGVQPLGDVQRHADNKPAAVLERAWSRRAEAPVTDLAVHCADGKVDAHCAKLAGDSACTCSRTALALSPYARVSHASNVGTSCRVKPVSSLHVRLICRTSPSSACMMTGIGASSMDRRNCSSLARRAASARMRSTAAHVRSATSSSNCGSLSLHVRGVDIAQQSAHTTFRDPFLRAATSSARCGTSASTELEEECVSLLARLQRQLSLFSGGHVVEHDRNAIVVTAHPRNLHVVPAAGRLVGFLGPFGDPGARDAIEDVEPVSLDVGMNSLPSLPIVSRGKPVLRVCAAVLRLALAQRGLRVRALRGVPYPSGHLRQERNFSVGPLSRRRVVDANQRDESTTLHEGDTSRRTRGHGCEGSALGIVAARVGVYVRDGRRPASAPLWYKCRPECGERIATRATSDSTNIIRANDGGVAVCVDGREKRAARAEHFAEHAHGDLLDFFGCVERPKCITQRQEERVRLPSVHASHESGRQCTPGLPWLMARRFRPRVCRRRVHVHHPPE